MTRRILGRSEVLSCRSSANFSLGTPRLCPAGRARYARGGHFVAGIPFIAGLIFPFLPLVGDEELVHR
jgi:hypothetical protein